MAAPMAPGFGSGSGSAALPVAWWSERGGFVGALAPVLGVMPSTVSGAAVNGVSDAGAGAGLDAHAGVYLIGIAHELDRDAARRAIRAAIRAALASLCGVPDSAIDIPAGPGETPYAAIATGADTLPRRIALAISHDEDVSVAAIGLDRAVGIDVTRIEDIPDWQALARDYLGPDTAANLAALAPDARPAALARAWSEREARLKCLGRELVEWREEDAVALAGCDCHELALIEGYVGVLALGRQSAR